MSASVLSEVSIELEDAVEEMMSFQTSNNNYDDESQCIVTIDVDDYESFNTNNDHRSHRNRRRRQCNTLERKRALRRVQRALISFETAMDDISNNATAASNNSTSPSTTRSNPNNHRHQSQSQILSLNESILNILLDILTEIPKTLPSYSIIYITHNNDHHKTDTATNGDSDQLFDCEIMPLTCSIIHKYALLPLDSSFIDTLLDHVVQIVSKCNTCTVHDDHSHHHRSNNQHLVCGQECFLYMMQIINNSLAVQDQTIQHHHHHQQQQPQQQLLQRKQKSFVLFQLDANETLVLITLFIKLSLKYLSHSWAFVTSKSNYNDCNNNSNNRKNRNVDHYHMNDIIEIDDDNHDHNVDRDNDVDCRHHQHQEDDIVVVDGGDEEEEETYNVEKDIHQESGVQVRLLVEHLFQHLTSLLQNTKSPSSTTKSAIGNSHTTTATNTASLEESLFQLFHPSNQHDDNDPHDYYYSNDPLSEQKLLVEDYIDLITSFLIESIEYAIDIVDSSSYYLRQFLLKQHHLQHHSQRRTATNSDTKNNMSAIRRHVKDTVRHCSLATSMIQIFYEDMKLHHDTSSSLERIDDSHLMSLFKYYSKFVAIYCTDELLHGSYCRSSPQEVEDVSALFDSADIVLFRLSHIVLNIRRGCREGNRKCAMQVDGRDAVLRDLCKSTSRGNKRRKMNKRQSDSFILFIDMPTTAVFLRSFHYCFTNSDCFDGEDYRTSKDVLLNAMGQVSFSLQRLFSHEYQRLDTNTCSRAMEYQSAAETTNLIQACALSTLMLSDCNNNATNTNSTTQLSSEEQLLASLLNPMISESKGNATKSNVDQYVAILDPLNPWSYLLGKKIVETIPWVSDWDNSNSNAVAATSVNMPANIVSTSSISTVSDLKSNNTSMNSSKSNDMTGIYNALNHKRTISSFVKAIPPGIDSTVA